MDDDPLGDALAQAEEERERFSAFIDALRQSDPPFAEASVLGPDDWGEWQGAVYLLSGSASVWGHFGRRVKRARSIGCIVEALEAGEGPSASSEREVMRWAAHLWDVERWPARYPYVFRPFLFRRWVTALHLRQSLAPALRRD